MDRPIGLTAFFLSLSFSHRPCLWAECKRKEKEKGRENYPWTIECFLEDLFLGGQSSIILVNRRLSVKFLPDI